MFSPAPKTPERETVVVEVPVLCRAANPVDGRTRAPAGKAGPAQGAFPGRVVLKLADQANWGRRLPGNDGAQSDPFQIDVSDVSWAMRWRMRSTRRAMSGDTRSCVSTRMAPIASCSPASRMASRHSASLPSMSIFIIDGMPAAPTPVQMPPQGIFQAALGKALRHSRALRCTDDHARNGILSTADENRARRSAHQSAEQILRYLRIATAPHHIVQKIMVHIDEDEHDEEEQR